MTEGLFAVRKPIPASLVMIALAAAVIRALAASDGPLRYPLPKQDAGS